MASGDDRQSALLKTPLGEEALMPAKVSQPSPCQGSRVATPVGVKCLRLRLSTVRPCSRAVAEINRSTLT
jgi:hypothetical protein